jgi:hypothetical protein
MLHHLKSYSNEQLFDELFKSNLGDYTHEELVSLRNTVWDGLQKNISHKDIAKKISSLNGAIAKESVSLSMTLVKAYYRIRTLQKALIAEIEWFEYTGFVRDKTRTFCRTRLNNRYHIDEILKMKNGVLEPAVFFCGGFECTHNWEPDAFYKP